MIQFSPPYMNQEIIDEVIDTLKSGWITTGKKTKLFEKQLTEYNGCKTTIAISSATAGLELILRWFGVKPGDEVILPAYTYSATANVIMHCGAKPVFVDVDKEDFNISVIRVKEAITSKTKVIMPVDFAGYPCDYDQINDLVKNDNIKSLFIAETDIQSKLGRILILSDAAHSMGSYYKNKRSGSLTDISVFSFHAVKNLTTAEGGAIAFNLPNDFYAPELYNYFSTIILHGQNKDAFSKTQNGNWEYDIIEPGYKANMTDILASIGLIQLKEYDNKLLKRRKEIFEQYSSLLQNYAWAETPTYKSKEKTSSYHIYALRIRNISINERNEIIKNIFKKNVSVNVHFKPVPMMSYYSKIGYNISDYPIAFDNFQREISLPVHLGLSDQDVTTVVNAVVKSVNEVLI